MTRNWKRAGLGVCGVTAIALTAGAAFAPAAQAATTSSTTTSSTDPVGGLLGGVVGGVGTVLQGTLDGVGTILNGVTGGVGDILGGLTGASSGTAGPTPTDSATTPVGTPTPTGSTSTGPTPGPTDPATPVPDPTLPVSDPTTPVPDPTISIPVPTPAPVETSPVPVVTDPQPTASDPAPVPTPVASTSAPSLSSLAVTSSVDTVYPAVDGYRDAVVFRLRGVTSDALVHAVRGTASLTYGSSTVSTWTITSTTQDLTWSGWVGTTLKPGRYVLTAVVTDAGVTTRATDELDVSAKKLVAATATVKSAAVSGTKTMTAKAKSAFAVSKVMVKVRTVATGVKGKQYLVFTHGAQRIKVLIRNGTHTTKAITVPSSFTSYKVTHTWKKGTVHLKSATYTYSFKTLK